MRQSALIVVAIVALLSAALVPAGDAQLAAARAPLDAEGDHADTRALKKARRRATRRALKASQGQETRADRPAGRPADSDVVELVTDASDVQAVSADAFGYFGGTACTCSAVPPHSLASNPHAWAAQQEANTHCFAKGRRAGLFQAALAKAKASAAEAKRKGSEWDVRTYTDAAGRDYYPWLFSKTFAHDADTGFALKDDVDSLLLALQCPSERTIGEIRLNAAPERTRKLEGVIGGTDFNTMGDDPARVEMAEFEPFAIDSARAAFEMAEVYAMSLLRDVPFSRLGTDPLAVLVLAELNKYPDKSTSPVDGSGVLTPQLLLRANVPGATVGPHVSQLLVHPFLYGNIPVPQHFMAELDSANTVKLSGWLAVQDGLTAALNPPPFGGQFGAYMPRVLGSIVHNDPTFCWCARAASTRAWLPSLPSRGPAARAPRTRARIRAALLPLSSARGSRAAHARVGTTMPRRS